MLPIVEAPEQRRIREQQIREHQAQALRALRALVRALDLAGLPQLPALEGEMATGLPHGGHVQLGGCNALVAQALADFVADHAHCPVRIVPAPTLPTGMAELPAVRGDLT